MQHQQRVPPADELHFACLWVDCGQRSLHGLRQLGLGQEHIHLGDKVGEAMVVRDERTDAVRELGEDANDLVLFADTQAANVVVERESL